MWSVAICWTVGVSAVSTARSFLKGARGNTWLQPRHFNWIRLKYVLFSPRKLGFHDPIWLAHIFFRWVGSAEPATRCILLYSWLPWLKEGCNMEMKQIWDRSNGQWDDYIRWFFISFCWDSWKNHPEFMVHGIELGGFSFHWFQAKIRTEQEVVITASWECSSDQFTLVTCCI